MVVFLEQSVRSPASGRELVQVRTRESIERGLTYTMRLLNTDTRDNDDHPIHAGSQTEVISGSSGAPVEGFKARVVIQTISPYCNGLSSYLEILV